MLKEKRHEIILNLIDEKQSVQMEELERELKVSGETVRRDLIQLEMQGLLRRVHGGAVLSNTTTHEFGVEVRRKSQAEEKQAIASAAVDTIIEGESIAVLASTTTEFMGSGLSKISNLTLITNSIPLAQQASCNVSNKVILVGGEVWLKDQKLMGRLAERALRNYRVDKLFFSASGISTEYGITEYNTPEAELTGAALEMGRKKIYLVDYTKFDSVAFHRIASAGDMDGIITDWKAGDDLISPYEEMGVRVTKAKKL